MNFADQLKRFATTTEKKTAAVFVGTVVELRDSIKFGSALTGAPAMPVAPGRFFRSGRLRDSVTVNYPNATTAVIYTTSVYAVDVEDNPQGIQFASGGPHGWKLTIAGFGRVVDAVAKRQAGGR